MRGQHGFCTLHRIGYNLDLDPTCPQCTLAGISGHDQLDFDTDLQLPVGKDGAVLDRKTLQPPKRFDASTGAPISS